MTFWTPAQRRRLREAATAPPVAQFLAPAVTASKRARVAVLARDKSPNIRASAASRPEASLEVLAQLARDDAESVRAAVARNHAAAVEILALLAKDNSALVRGWVASNPTIARADLDKLARDPDPTVRRVVQWAKAWE